jgi:predicted dehydrogenase
VASAIRWYKLTAMSLGVGVVGIGWCATQHIKAFQKNPHTRIVALVGRDEQRIRETLAKNGVTIGSEVRITTRYEDLLNAADVDIISVATPNNLHAAEAVAGANAGKHLLIEKPTGLDEAELVAIRDAVRKGGVRTIVSFELRYNSLLKFMKWFRESGWLGEVRFARAQYMSRVTDWYAGWDWCRTKEGGRSHLLAAGCHAVDALRWCSGLEAAEVSAYHAHFTEGYEWPTTIDVNIKFEGNAIGHVTSSTDFMMPYSFSVELMGDKATIRDTLILWKDQEIDLARLRAEQPFPEITLTETTYGSASKGIRIDTPIMPDSVDVDHHPFQAEIDDFVDAIRNGRETMLNVDDAQKTMELCIAADRSAAQGGTPVKLPLVK